MSFRIVGVRFSVSYSLLQTTCKKEEGKACPWPILALSCFLAWGSDLVCWWLHAWVWLTLDAMNASKRCETRGAVPMKLQWVRA